MISLVSLIASASATGAVLTMCSGKDRQATRKPSKSSKSKRDGSKSSRASSSKSHRSEKSEKSTRSRRDEKSKKSRRSSKSGKKSGMKSSSSKKPGVVDPADATKKSKSDSKDRSSKSKRSKRSSKSGKKSKKCKAMQCEPNKLKEEQKRNTICPSSMSDASSKSSCGKVAKDKKSSKSNSLSGEKSGEKVLKMVPNSSNYKFPEGQIKPSTLRASPNKLPFAPTGGVQTVHIANSTKSRKAFKVKTSDNMLYRVNPVFGFVEPGDKLSIDVLRHNGMEKTDHLVVLTSDATPEQKCAKGVFETDPPRELTVVPLVAH